MTAPLTWAMSGRLRQGSWGGCGSVEGMQEKHRNHDSRTSRLRNSPHNRPEHHPITGIGHERVRAMIYGPVATSRIAYRKKGKENLYPQDAGLNSAGWRGHRRGVRRSAPPRLRSPAAVVRRGGRQQPPDRDHHHARRGLPGQGAHPDRPHSCDEYLWKAANSFFYPGDPAARAWVKDQTAKILAGKHRDVRAGIRRRATTYSYSPAERAGADECADYLRAQAGLPGLPRLPRRRMARGQRSHRGRGTLDRQGQTGTHRRQMGPGRRRSRPQAPRPARHRRPRRLPRLPLPVLAPAASSGYS